MARDTRQRLIRAGEGHVPDEIVAVSVIASPGGSVGRWPTAWTPA
jgi:hypothetical protein